MIHFLAVNWKLINRKYQTKKIRLRELFWPTLKMEISTDDIKLDNLSQINRLAQTNGWSRVWQNPYFYQNKLKAPLTILDKALMEGHSCKIVKLVIYVEWGRWKTKIPLYIIYTVVDSLEYMFEGAKSS